MFLKELLQEQNMLQLTLTHHLNKLYAPDNPSGILLCQKHDNSYRWQRKYQQNGYTLTTDLRKSERQLAEKLAVNLYRIVCIEYLQKQQASIDVLIRSLHGEIKEDPMRNSFKADYSMHKLLHKVRNRPHVPADFFHLQSPYRSLILSHLEKEYTWIINWYLGAFKQNPEHPEYLLFPVKLGFKVRSKSEVMEADRLYEEGILFHYEELILLSNEEFYPDFNIPITIIERYIWEHFGAMDKDGYFYRTKGRINDYLDHKWFPGINMITTYETKQHPLTAEQVEQQIYFLKCRYRLAFPDLPSDESFNLYDLAAHVKLSRSDQ